jgi:chromosome segregation ATPase
MIDANSRFLFSPDDPMNFLPSDRLSKVKTIPVVDVQQRLDESYQDQIEILHLRVLDTEEALKREQDQNACLRKSIDGLQANMAGHSTMMNDRNAAVARCTSMESQVKKLEENLKTEVGNRDHFRSLVAEQDKFLNELKQKMGKAVGEQKAVLEAQKRVSLLSTIQLGLLKMVNDITTEYRPK